MTIYTSPAADPPIRTAEEKEHDERWAAWRANAAAADASTDRQAKWLAAAMLGASGLWLAFELTRSGPLMP